MQVAWVVLARVAASEEWFHCYEGVGGVCYPFHSTCTDCSTGHFNSEAYSPWGLVQAAAFCGAWGSNQGLPSDESKLTFGAGCCPGASAGSQACINGAEGYDKHPQRLGCHSGGNLGWIDRPTAYGYPETIDGAKAACDYLQSTGVNCIGFAYLWDWGVQLYNELAVNRDLCNGDDGLLTNTPWTTYLRRQPTCEDGVLNGDETGVDCGGSCGTCNCAEVTGWYEMSFNGVLQTGQLYMNQASCNNGAAASTTGVSWTFTVSGSTVTAGSGVTGAVSGTTIEWSNGYTYTKMLCGNPGCSNGGTCVDGACECPAGFTGDACQTEVDECANDPCGAGGTCSDLVNGFSCACNAGYTGETCGITVTTSPTGCACFEDPDDFTCACCAEDACQCGGIASDTCALCTDTETCAAVVREKQLNDPNAVSVDILTSSGCPCFFDNTKDCACCKPGRCQCDKSAETYNFASVDLSDKCVPCSEDCNAQWIDRSLDGSWVIMYPEPTEGQYGEMVWQVDGSVVRAHYLSGLLPGQNDTVFVGTVAKVPTLTNTYTVTGLHASDIYGNVPSETVTVSADGLTLRVVGATANGQAASGCDAATPGIGCTVDGFEGDGSFRLTTTGLPGGAPKQDCPCWWDPNDLSCACCSDGGCGCGGPQDPLTAKDETAVKGLCVPCSKWWRCDPQPLPELVESRTTYRCDKNHNGNDCTGAADEQPLLVTESYLDYTESHNGCPSWADPSVDGACCRKGGCQCGIDPLYHISPNLCVPCDEPERCLTENVIATWKLGEWSNCSQPCTTFSNGVQIIGHQVRSVTCSDQFYNPLPESRCEAETRIDPYAGNISTAQFPTKDVTDWPEGTTPYWFGGVKPLPAQHCNLHTCKDYTCYKTSTERTVSIEPYGRNRITEPLPSDEDKQDDTCPTFLTECHFDSQRFDCARCLPGGCQCSWEPVKHLCVSCDVGGSACIGAIPDGDPFFSWEWGQWSGCDKACAYNGDVGVQHRVVTCRGEDGGSYADHRCDPLTMPDRTRTCNTHSCADEYTHTDTGCPCWFDLSDTSCGCCKPGSDGSAGCQITTPENPDLVGCDHCPGAPPQSPRPTPAPTPLPTAGPTLAPQDLLACTSDAECPDDDFCVHGTCRVTTTTTTTSPPPTPAPTLPPTPNAIPGCSGVHAASPTVPMTGNGLKRYIKVELTGANWLTFAGFRAWSGAQEHTLSVVGQTSEYSTGPHGGQWSAEATVDGDSSTCYCTASYSELCASITYEIQGGYGLAYGVGRFEIDNRGCHYGPVSEFRVSTSDSLDGTFEVAMDWTGVGDEDVTEFYAGGLSGTRNGGPGEFKSWHGSDKCLDYALDGSRNVYMHNCHGGNNQYWSIDASGQLKTAHDDLCLDFNYNENNVFMHPCHGGTNQQWVIDEHNNVKSRWPAASGKCLDWALDGSNNVYMHDCHNGNNQKWEFSPSSRRLEAEPRELAEEESPECMMCVSGTAPELARCNPGNPARYLGHAECCRVWADALDGCDAHCSVGAKTRKLATCSKLDIGQKDASTCDQCLEGKLAGSSTGSDCGVWKQLLPQCEGPCEPRHRNYQCDAALEPPAAAAEATPASCRRCVLGRSPEVTDCLPDASGAAPAECCGKWQSWLSSCAAECPAPAAAGQCDVNGAVEANFVDRRPGWPMAAVCEQCVQRQGGQKCLGSPDSGCCDQWEKDWEPSCRFQCGREGAAHVHGIVCGGDGLGFSAAAAVVLAWFF